jgi:ribonuclease E
MAPRNNKKQNSPKQDNKTRLLVDASHIEETRVAVVQNGRLQDLEVESLLRKQVKGNIYLAKVTRVEPSLQAAFVDYGGNRHGFLPFSEIHPDYYRIPVADRERLMAEQVELERAAEEEAARIAAEEDLKAEQEAEETAAKEVEDNIEEIEDEDTVLDAGSDAKSDDSDEDDDNADEDTADEDNQENVAEQSEDDDDNAEKSEDDKKQKRGRGRYRNRRGGRKYSASRNKTDRVSDDEDDDTPAVEPFWKRIRRAYKIQEVIKRGQIMLIQVGKEERGNKGAAVTSYITLPGRYCVLMPNTPQSGGVSRKISNYKDRKRMREILKDLNVPEGMSVILRTAGTTRTKAEIKRDLDYLMRLWNNARELTLKSTAPALINEEGSLIKRAIRDIYNKDIDEVIVSGDDGYAVAHDMMKMLMPSHVKKVVNYKDPAPLFITQKIESQIEGMHSPEVELKSGGYLVINPTEALISVDVNSGRSTKERNIEDTALRTNIEAAEELARQLKLRDLGGLVVVDFIDMEKRSYNGKVERAMRNALAGDRARIQMGRISSFGLMEMSRQRLHPSLTEAHFEPCPHCHGMGIVKTVDTMALTVLRALEQSGIEKKNANVTITMHNDVAIYLLNNHRSTITDIENRYSLNVQFKIDAVDNERGFELTSEKRKSQPKQKEVEDSNTASEQPQNEKQTPKKNNNRRKKQKVENKEADVVKDEVTQAQPEEVAKEEVAQSEEKPTPKKRGRPSKKKIEIEEVSEEKSKEPKESKGKKPKAEKKVKTETEEKPLSPTNDNAGEKAAEQQTDEAVNQAAREAETVNETPKKKKKGWWNKITN